MGKRVKIRGDYKEAPKNINRHTALCQSNKKECDGNCSGCAVMLAK
jgi:hypothetical protein